MDERRFRVSATRRAKQVGCRKGCQTSAHLLRHWSLDKRAVQERRGRPVWAGTCQARGLTQHPTDLTPLVTVRQRLYAALNQRQDSLFELVDAVLTAPGRSALVRLSLCPVFRRRWPSTCDALADGSLDVAALRTLFLATLPRPADGRPLWVVDATMWPRPAAATSPARTFGQVSSKGTPSSTTVAVWEEQWLVAVPEPRAGGSWALPLDIERRDPVAPTPTPLAIRQLRRARATQVAQAPATPRPVAALDSGSHPDEWAAAHLDADLVVRLAGQRVFERALAPYAGPGRPRTHGPAFRLKDAATHGAPDHHATLAHPVYGTVTVDAWDALRTPTHPDAPFTVVRHPHPLPLWLAWIGGPFPADPLDVWRWYLARFTVEHLFRFLKQTLGWTTVRLRAPEAADRWTWLVAAAVWQLWLARPLVADCRLPWERPLTPARLTPGRVRRAFSGLLPRLGSPARAPTPRGKSPGRRPGQHLEPAPRFAALHRSHPTAA